MKSKKGFTLVELLIVIAIVAILATVSIIGYTSFIDKANQSVDMQLVKQMNIVLEAYEINNEKPATVVDAKAVLIENRLDDFTPIDELNVFYWVGSENRVLLWTKDSVDSTTGKITFPDDLAKKYKNLTEPTSEWADLSSDYVKGVNYFEVETVEGEEVYTTLLSTISSAPDGAVIKLPENSVINTNGQVHKIGEQLANTSGIGKTLTIDLNGSTLDNGTSSKPISVPQGGSLELVNGTVNMEMDVVNRPAISADSGAHLVLRNVTIETNGAAVYPTGNASEVVIDNSTIKGGAYGIGTNAVESSNVRISVTNSTVEGTNAFIVNTASEVYIDNCQLIAEGWGLIVREGYVNISNSTITTTDGDVNKDDDFYREYSLGYKNFSYTQNSDGAPFWGQGYQMPYSVVTVGDYSNGTAYNGNATLIMTNVKLVSANSEDMPDIVLAAQMSGKNVSVTYDDACTVGKVVVFGEDYNRSGVTHEFRHDGTITVNGASKTLDD